MKTLNREKIRRIVGDAGMSPGTVVGGSGSGSGGSGGGSANYAAEAGHAQTADEATHATSADSATAAETAEEATHATAAANLDANSTDWSKIMRKDIAQTAAEVVTFAKGLVSTMVAKFKAGLKIGASDQYGIDANGDATLRDIGGRNLSASGTLGVTGNTTIGGTLGVTGNTTIGGTLGVTGKLTGDDAEFNDVVTENLTVTKEATFFKLTVNELASNKGAIIASSANCVIEMVSEATNWYDVYFSKTDKDGKAVVNPWILYDQALCLTFTGQAGAWSGNNIKNRYYWRVVVGIAADDNYPDYHHIRLSKYSGQYDGNTAPAAGDEIVQLGYRGSVSGVEYRKSAVILSAYPTMDTGVTPPSLAFYKGITDFNLSNHRYTYIDGLSNEFIGNFSVLINGSYQNVATLLMTMDGLISNVKATMLVSNMFGNLTSGWKYLPYGGSSRSVTPVMGWFSTADDYDAIISPNVTLTAGKTYCLSFYSEIDGFNVDLYTQNGTLVRSLTCSTVGGGDTLNNYDRYYVTVQVQTTAVYYISFSDTDDQQYLVGMPLLEEGTSPSPAVMYSSIIAQTANQIDLNVTSKLGQAGVNINGSTRQINLIAGKVNFLTSSGQTNPKISIDPTTGALNAVDGTFSGTLRATLFEYKIQMNGTSGNDTILATTDEFVLGETTGIYSVNLPCARTVQGKKITIIKAYSATTLKLFAKALDGTTNCPIAFYGNTTQISNPDEGYPLSRRTVLWSDPDLCALDQTTLATGFGWRLIEQDKYS